MTVRVFLHATIVHSHVAIAGLLFLLSYLHDVFPHLISSILSYINTTALLNFHPKNLLNRYYQSDFNAGSDHCLD